MAKKLSITPDVSYMLGIYNCNSRKNSIYVSSSNNELVERFVKIAVLNLGVNLDYVHVVKEEDYIEATINNSKLKKLFDKALETRDRAFKYKNEYSASYFAGMFDCKGAVDRKGLFMSGISAYDAVILERIGFHTTGGSGKTYIKNDMDFIMFIEPFSIRAKIIRKANKKRN